MFFLKTAQDVISILAFNRFSAGTAFRSQKRTSEGRSRILNVGGGGVQLENSIEAPP